MNKEQTFFKSESIDDNTINCAQAIADILHLKDRIIDGLKNNSFKSNFSHAQGANTYSATLNTIVERIGDFENYGNKYEHDQESIEGFIKYFNYLSKNLPSEKAYDPYNEFDIKLDCKKYVEGLVQKYNIDVSSPLNECVSNYIANIFKSYSYR